MYKGNSSRILPILLILIVVAIAIAGLVSLGRMVFGGDQTDPTQVDVGRDALLNTSVDRSVRMTLRGPIVADEEFRSYQVTVTPAMRRIVTYSGYLELPIQTKQYSNNVKAYEEFVHALDKANMMKGEAFEDEKDDTRGVCATGNVYEFEVLRADSSVKRLWTSTCQGSAGSFKANIEQVEGLFLEQIPEAREVLKDLDI
jgi:hypothetical protein